MGDEPTGMQLRREIITKTTAPISRTEPANLTLGRSALDSSTWALDSSESKSRPVSPSGITALSAPQGSETDPPETEAAYLQMKPPLSHFLLASVFSGKSNSGLWSTSTSTESSACTRGRRRSSSAETMSWNGKHSLGELGWRATTGGREHSVLTQNVSIG